jgi:hypothetical protein
MLSNIVIRYQNPHAGLEFSCADFYKIIEAFAA